MHPENNVKRFPPGIEAYELASERVFEIYCIRESIWGVWAHANKFYDLHPGGYLKSSASVRVYGVMCIHVNKFNYLHPGWYLKSIVPANV